MDNVKVHKVTILIVDHDNLGRDGVTSVIENTKYPNWCIHPKVVDTDTREVEWSDDHPLNQRVGWRGAYEAIFMAEKKT